MLITLLFDSFDLLVSVELQHVLQSRLDAHNYLIVSGVVYCANLLEAMLVEFRGLQKQRLGFGSR